MDTKELRELLAQANRGPWELEILDHDHGIYSYRISSINEDDGSDVLLTDFCSHANARLIVAAINALPALLDAYDENAGLREALAEAMEWNWLDDDMSESVRWECERLLEDTP